MRPNRAFVASLAVLALVVAGCRDLAISAQAPDRASSHDVATSADQVLEEAARIDGLQSVLAQREGEMLLEGYFEGAGENRLFHLRSATKSVTSLLIGIAIDQGLLDSVDQTLGEVLGPRVARFGPGKADLTVRHLLTMTAGLEWKELGDVDEYNRFRVARDPVAHYLGRPFVDEPGERWNYSSGASHLLSVVLSEVTGTTARDYARKVLFEPLDIDTFRWERHHDGNTNGAAGLELRARDSLKLGELVLGRGVWSDRRVVSEEWIESSTSSQIQSDGGGHYGYQWWVEFDPLFIVSALGFAGQVISVVPEEKAIVVTHCRWRGLDRPSAAQSDEVLRFIRERLAPFVLPGLRSREDPAG